MAPPSVGVATPMKIVPSTRKISASGGIMTKVTRSAICDSKPRRRILLSTAMTKAAAPQIRILVTISSSTCTLSSSRNSTPAKAMPTDRAISTSSEGMPCPPLGSTKVRASGGMAGADFGLNRAIAMTYRMYSPVRAKPGRKAPLYMSPMERPSWSASTISTSDGGMICDSVPDAAITPVARRRS